MIQPLVPTEAQVQELREALASLKNGEAVVLARPAEHEVLHEAFLPTMPVPKGNGKFAIGSVVLSDKRQRRAARTLAGLALMTRPAAPFAGDLGLDVTVVLPRPTAEHPVHPSERQVMPGDTPRSRPQVADRGNYLKLVEDALQAGGWIVDDVAIVDGAVKKRWGPVPGYHLRLWRCEADA